MAGIKAWFTRFSGLFSRRNRDAELADELNGHLDAHIDDNIRAGMSPDEAPGVRHCSPLAESNMTKEALSGTAGHASSSTCSSGTSATGFRVAAEEPWRLRSPASSSSASASARTPRFSAVVNAVILAAAAVPRCRRASCGVWQTPPESFFVPAGDRRIFAGLARELPRLGNAEPRVRPDGLLSRLPTFQRSPARANRTLCDTACGASASFFTILGLQPPWAGHWVPLIEASRARARRGHAARKHLADHASAPTPPAIGRPIALNGEPYTIVGVVPQRAAFPEQRRTSGCPLRVDTPRSAPIRSNHNVPRHRPR